MPAETGIALPEGAEGQTYEEQSYEGQSYEGWHFLPADRRIAVYQNADGSASAHAGKCVTPGMRLCVPGPVAPARFGLHASQRVAEAVFHAPGLVICRVRLSGQVVRANHYACATVREVLWMADAERAVWAWLTWCATNAIERAKQAGYPVEAATRQAVRTRLDWLEGKPNAVRGMEEARGPARGALRRALNYHVGNGKACQPKSSGAVAPLLVRVAAGQAVCLCLLAKNSHRQAASRPAGWFNTELGRAENAELERLLLALPNKEMPLAPQGQAVQTHETQTCGPATGPRTHSIGASA